MEAPDCPTNDPIFNQSPAVSAVQLHGQHMLHIKPSWLTWQASFLLRCAQVPPAEPFAAAICNDVMPVAP
jgi:hypothetical protein